MVIAKAGLKINEKYQKFRHSNLRHTIWPIRSYELFKFTPMVILMFTILLNQNIVRSLKDSLVMSYIGAESINFIKFGVEMPLGIIFVVVYTNLCKHFSTEAVFRYVIMAFLFLYTIFAFLIFPYRDSFHPDPAYVSELVAMHPHIKWPILMWGKWSYVIMYALGELWPLVAFSLLFWQLANKITKIDEASRFYPFFTVFGQANSLIAGSIVMYFSSNNHIFFRFFSDLTDSTEIIVKSLTIVVCISGILCICVQKYIEINVIKANLNPTENIKLDNQTKLKIGFFDSFKMVIKSPYLLSITGIVLCYNFSINLVEGILMFKAKTAFPTPEEFIKYQGLLMFWIGVVTISCAIIATGLIRRCGWLLSAILTPIVLLITGFLFFQGVIFESELFFLKKIFPDVKPLLIVVYIGALQHILSKGVKYSLCDATKEMTYIPLSDKQKTNGKAAVDIVGTKIGKSCGASLQILIFTFFPMVTYNDLASTLCTLMVIVCIAWIFSVMKLSKLYNKKISA